MDCGPSCLKMVSDFYGKDANIEFLREKCYVGKNGVSFAGISEAAEHIGLNSLAVSLGFESLRDEVPLPCIAHWDQQHFVTVFNITKKNVVVGDPAIGLLSLSHEEFIKGWLNDGQEEKGYLLLLETTPAFYNDDDDHLTEKSDLGFIWQYFKDYKKEIWQLTIGILFASLLQLILPFLTQAVVDYGISYHDLNFVYLILVAQVVVFISMSSVQFIRGWILLFLTQKVNIRLISDFLLKLMRLPISFFDSKHSGDIIQRINDNKKIQDFLSSSSLITIFSLFTVLVFSVVLLHYSLWIFLVFLVGSIAYLGWSLLFLKKLAQLDHRRFEKESDNQRSIWQLISGMQEIKLNGSQRKRRWEWEGIQIKLFKISSKNLAVEQRQDFGALFINQFTNIIIAFLSAKYVIEGSLSLGAMLAIQFILGQLNIPLNSIISFVKTAQEAKLSLLRMKEIHNRAPEDDADHEPLKNILEDIHVQKLDFRYGPKSTPLILNKLDITFKKGQTTAIVGTSGSGKTTFLKLLLRFYDTYLGNIYLGDTELRRYSVKDWRKQCGTVMQDGFIFEDTILSNITESEGENEVDRDRYQTALDVANLNELINSLPSGNRTRIGTAGVALSGGERQRVLIARAVYKNPSYLFFDEATSALDAINEREIMKNLDAFYKGKTTIIIAHRLSTVKKADKIIVMSKGRIVEEGTHSELIGLNGHYFELVKNQLELGT